MAPQPESPLTPDAASPARDRFHHGSLRLAAVAAALALVERAGTGALSLREVAKATGVNHRALYRHFADLDDLSVAVAAEGFGRLRDAIAAALEAGSTPPAAKARAMLGAYVDFALGNPRLYALMFTRPGADFLSHPVLAPAVAGVTDLAGEAFRRPGDPPGFSPALRDRVMLAWGAAHGLCDLWLRGALRARGREEAGDYIKDRLAELSWGQGRT